jgi:hypothetical protein
MWSRRDKSSGNQPSERGTHQSFENIPCPQNSDNTCCTDWAAPAPSHVMHDVNITFASGLKIAPYLTIKIIVGPEYSLPLEFDGSPPNCGLNVNKVHFSQPTSIEPASRISDDGSFYSSRGSNDKTQNSISVPCLCRPQYAACISNGSFLSSSITTIRHATCLLHNDLSSSVHLPQFL